MPIVDSFLETQWDPINQKHYLIGYFIDIYSNIVSFNLSNYFQWNQNRSVPLQPIKYHPLFYNFTIKDPLYLQRPLLFTKHRDMLATINLAGTLRLFDITQEKSWLNMMMEAKTHQFGYKCLSATSSQHKQQTPDNLVVIVLDNKKVPYPFVNC